MNRHRLCNMCGMCYIYAGETLVDSGRDWICAACQVTIRTYRPICRAQQPNNGKKHP